MKKIAAFGIACIAASCAHARPSPSALGASAANFTYFTPLTKLNLNGDFVLLRCSGNEVLVSSTLALASNGSANTALPFTLTGTALMSAMQRRELTIELNDNGTIKSLNATASDRTGTVITNILKTVGSIVGAVFGVGDVRREGGRLVNPGPCNDETYAALVEVNQLRADIERWQATLSGASPDDVESIGQRIDLMARRVAVLTTTRLTISLSRPLTVGDNPAANQPIRWTFADLRKWFGDPASPTSCVPHSNAGRHFSAPGADPCEATTDLLQLTYTITADNVAPAADRVAQSACGRPEAERPEDCGRTIVMPRPVLATVVFRTATDGIVGQPANSILGRANVPIPQWGYATYLPLNVRLFQSRGIGFTFNAFGQRQSFRWNSEATAENATSAIVAAADAAATVISNAEGQSNTERWNAESAELEARMKLNRLRLCEEAIRAGATTCP